MSCLGWLEKARNGEKDKKLANWKKWLEIRRRLHRKLLIIQNRIPDDVILNSSEYIRSKNEEKTIFEIAKIPQFVSNRGKPSFWILPPASFKFPELISVATKAQIYEIPEMTYIGVPIEVQLEKDLFYGATAGNKMWNKSKYRKQRHKELEKEIKRVEPHKPEMDELIIVGNKPVAYPATDFLEYLSEYPQEIEGEPESPLDPEEIFVASLQIEQYIFDSKVQQETQKHFIAVNYDITKKDTSEFRLSIQNLGNISLKYWWKPFLPEQPMKKHTPRRLPTFFFIFKKNVSIILPGENKNVKIYFRAEKPGIYKETWELHTKPNLFLDGRFILNLFACAEVGNFEEIETAITNRIEDGLKYTIAKDVLMAAVTATVHRTTKERPTPQEFVTEKQIFEAVNAKFGGPGSLPFINYYNKDLVNNLKLIYDSLKGENDPEKWSYKIEDVQRVINNCENAKDVERNNADLQYILANLFKSSMIENVEAYKYDMVYQFLCVMVDQIVEKGSELREKYSIPVFETYPVYSKQFLLKHQKDDEYRSTKFLPDVTQLDPMKHIHPCDVSEFQRPPMEVLRSIPFEDVKLKYKMYQMEKYGILVEDEDAPADGKKGKGKGKGKDKGKEKAKGKGKEPKDKKAAAKPGKDEKGKSPKGPTQPSVNIELSLTDLLQQITNVGDDSLRIEEFSVRGLAMYRYNLFVYSYTLFCKTMDEIVDLLERLKNCRIVSRDILKTCIDLGVPILQPEQKRGLILRKPGDIFDLKLKKSESAVPTISEMSIRSNLSRSDSDYFPRASSSMEGLTAREYIDAQTETDRYELYPPRTRIEASQTETDDNEFDLLAIIEREISATSVQYMKPRTKNKATQKN